MSQALRALHHPNYRLFFIGQAISLIGTWMQSVALQWLIYRMTGSAVLLGTVTFATLIPTFIISPFAGVVIDRMDKRRVIIATQVLFLLEASILGALVLAGTIQVWQILALSAAVGIASAFDMPGRQAFMVEIVERKENLSNAIALNSSQFNLARLIGPPIAGLVIHLFGEGICFLLNAASYIAVIGALLAIRIPAAAVEIRTSNMAEELRDMVYE